MIVWDRAACRSEILNMTSLACYSAWAKRIPSGVFTPPVSAIDDIDGWIFPGHGSCPKYWYLEMDLLHRAGMAFLDTGWLASVMCVYSGISGPIQYRVVEHLWVEVYGTLIMLYVHWYIEMFWALYSVLFRPYYLLLSFTWTASMSTFLYSLTVLLPEVWFVTTCRSITWTCYLLS